MSLTPSGPTVVLAPFQQRAVAGIAATLERVASYHEQNPQHRRAVALQSGGVLLQAPTGSGKTLVLGRALEATKGCLHRPTVWFWFAPYSGLIGQTREALAETCGSLRIRDVGTDRNPDMARDGDVFIQTWASVAARQAASRRVRRSTESEFSLDEMLEAVRARGFFVGVVIDEAHINFGASAAVAADFYLNVLSPDFTLLATATPNDQKLEQFETAAGIAVASRIVVSRQEVVEARLNKRGLMAAYLRFRPEDAELVDLEQATLAAAWSQHQYIKGRLQDLGVSLTPLMLVQVEDQGEDGDPVKRVSEKLEQAGVPASVVAIHTSGQPDPDFHTLAYDPSKEVLIFKVSVATGFDAPRAWTLVSVRPSRGVDFGLQIVGRIMRVHPLIRALVDEDPVLNRGYVFLTDPTLQAGLDLATQELQAVQRSIDLISDQLDFVQFGSASEPLVGRRAEMSFPTFSAPKSSAERQQRIADLIDGGYVQPHVLAAPPALQDQAIEAGETLRSIGETPLFGELPRLEAPGQAALASRLRTYPLRAELGIPRALARELPPDPAALGADFVTDVAARFCAASSLIPELHRRRRRASMTLRDLFVLGEELEREFSVNLSNSRLAERAQLAFRFNDSIDPRALKRALVDRLRAICVQEGVDFEEADLRRAIDLAAMREPDRLTSAMRAALAVRVQVSRTEDIPLQEFYPEGSDLARKAAYGAFPHRLNNEERAFAELLDGDQTGTVQWWLRNVENATWATRLILPNGRRFFPDFVVGVGGRSTPDAIALIEIKDDGVTGRLQSDSNAMKIRVHHREYQNVFWTYRLDGTWARARFDEGLHRILPQGQFNIAELVYIS